MYVASQEVLVSPGMFVGDVELSAVCTKHIRKYWSALECSWEYDVYNNRFNISRVGREKQLQSWLQKHAKEVFMIFVVQHLTQFDSSKIKLTIQIFFVKTMYNLHNRT